ncbi:hypothetical protein FQB35_10295 [Crassaminicella thermophila]|uniref:Bro-N domain-containing protein n=1 Tax=Crassaminicella thermophila TaxID=2599308 RepID=A0A5C0SHK2_CRATE|nr:BRO family protein [Crassaminicella thermophila]QEK12688.1 hypothetical protein FQB35_10295 [Crassaminicella thermophila]
MKELTLFKGHQVRIVLDKESNAYFHAQDVGDVLEIEDVKSTIRNYGEKHKIRLTNSDVQDMHFRNFDEPLNNRGENFLTEAGVYKLSFRSPKREAEEFTDWVTSEVLPSIRKEGAYITNNANPEMLRDKADEIESLTTLNETAKIMLPVLDKAGLKPQYQALALKQIYRKAGIDLPIEELKADKEIFDLESIAKVVGIYSKTNKPHGQAIKAILENIEIGDNEKETVSFEKNGHMGTTTQYTKTVIDKVKQWLLDNNYPTDIKYVTSTNRSKTYRVVYINNGGEVA